MGQTWSDPPATPIFDQLVSEWPAIRAQQLVDQASLSGTTDEPAG